MGYEKVFEKPYSGGWKDLPDRTTPVTAAVMDDYDEAIEHIENHLNGSSAVFPIQATGGMTQPVGIDENGRLVTMPTGGGGGESASEITYDNTESGLESTDVQGAIDELAAGAGEKVTPVTKTEDMTQSVGIDENGELWTEPGGGSGGGSGYTVTTLCTPASTDTTYNLSDSINNYDEILLICQINDQNKQFIFENKFPSAEMVDSIGQTYRFGVTSDSAYIYFSVSSADTLVKDISSGNMFVVRIAGIKYGSGGGSGFDETVILDTPVQATVSTPITLDEAVTNYDQIRIRAYMLFNGMKLWSDNLFQSDDFILGDTNDQHWIFIDNNDLCYFSMSADGTQLVIASVAGSVYIGEVVGIKYGSGAENTWTKLLDVREESSQTASSYTLADDITNYNTIAVSGYFVHSLGNIIYVETLPIGMIEIDSSVHQICIDTSHIVTVKFPTSTSVESVGQSGGTYIYQVYGK